MDQPTFSDLEYQGKKRKTRRELFLERMDGLIPWQQEQVEGLWSSLALRPLRQAVRVRFCEPCSTALRTFRWEATLQLSPEVAPDIWQEEPDWA